MIILEALQIFVIIRLGLVVLITNLAKRQRITQQTRIVDGPLFPQIKQRRSEIDKIHKDLFPWLLDLQKINLVERLRHENGIYWICGGAGSGQSTIIKVFPLEAGSA